MGLGTIILAGVVLVVVAAAFAGSIAWVWRDAERRGQPCQAQAARQHPGGANAGVSGRCWWWSSSR